MVAQCHELVNWNQQVVVPPSGVGVVERAVAMGEDSESAGCLPSFSCLPDKATDNLGLTMSSVVFRYMVYISKPHMFQSHAIHDLGIFSL